MIEASEAYKNAVVAQKRRMKVRATVDLTDPDIVYGAIEGVIQSTWSKPAQIHDRVLELTPLASMEPGRWLLDGSFQLPPPGDLTQVGFETSELYGLDKTKAGFLLDVNFSGVALLQEVAIYFPGADYDGYGVDFSVLVYADEAHQYSKSFTGNTAHSVRISGFELYNPQLVRLIVTKWSLPLRRMRIPEIVLGVYEVWTDDDLSGFALNMQGDFSDLALPYSTCTLTLDNKDRRFEPRNKTGVFKSIEDRQGIKTEIGADLGSDTEYVPTGTYYQYAGGWKTGNNDITITWNLVDIIGLLVDRRFEVPTPLPTTLSGWAEALVSQLGANFSTYFQVDPDYAALPITAVAEALADVTCGDVLLWICQATETWPRADAETGYLTIEPFWSEGNVLDLDNLETYPTMTGNDDIARIDFTLSDGTALSIGGTSSSSSNTASVNNPFLHTEAAARAAARMMLSAYGGNRIETTGRGNPTSEIGDVATVQLDETNATTGRLLQQNFDFNNGVLSGCKSVLLQADGAFLYQNRAVFTSSGTWTVPAGVSSLRLILVGHGYTGGDGTDGTFEAAGTPGNPGAGGKVWAGTVAVSGGQTYNITIGNDTTFGSYSSANGTSYPNGYTDIASGDSYARPGVEAPVAGTGDGGMGGAGGYQGRKREVDISEDDLPTYITVIDAEPTEGLPGKAGVSGCAVIYWDN